MSWQAYSPDGLPIAPKSYKTEAAAREALRKWIERFYFLSWPIYAAADGRRIPISKLPECCAVRQED